jgi:hypothetical protein
MYSLMSMETLKNSYHQKCDDDTDGDDEIAAEAVVVVDPHHVLGDRVGKRPGGHALK